MKEAFGHILWIGGATDAGKTSVARALAGRYGWQAYHYDQYDHSQPPGHWARIDPLRHPHLHAEWARSRNDWWVHTTPSDMLDRWLLTTPERFDLTLEDLRSLPSARPIVAEGYGLLPDLVLPLLSSKQQAIWLVSTEEFKRSSYERRGKGSFTFTSDPQRARQNHIGRDLLIAAYIKRRAADLGLAVVEVDGGRPLEEVVALVARRFSAYLNDAERHV